MKLVFVPARSKLDIKPVLKKVKIQGNIGLVASVQFLHKLDEASKIIKNSVVVGQVLGCNFTKADEFKDIDAFLYIGSAPFHPLGLAIHSKKPVYIANPLTNEVGKIDEKDVLEYEKSKKGKILQFLHANKIGILVSVKPHQGNFKRALELQEKLEGKKEAFIFVCDEINPMQFENFNDIECWVNTACPRIDIKGVVGLHDIAPYLE